MGKNQLFIREARQQTTDASDLSSETAQLPLSELDSKTKLKGALLDLQKHSRTYVNTSRLQLALRGLEQSAGEEIIRVAILSLAGQGNTFKKARQLVRLLLADPLKEEEEWERILVATQDGSKPLLLRIGDKAQVEGGNYGFNNKLVQELNITSPSLKNHHLEILVLESDILAETTGEEDVMSTVLVPTVEIPTSNTGRYTPVTTPVHKALILGDGILGAASLVNLSAALDSQIILPAVDITSYPVEQINVPLQITDVALANAALESFRLSVDNAMSYEHDWFKSGLPEVLGWLKDGSLDNPGVMKSPVRDLITSVLAETVSKIQDEESRQLVRLLKSKVKSSDLQSLRRELEAWAQEAHTELRDQLDLAFIWGRWRKLNWWKLFWRVDDVSMMASDVLNQRFLTVAEKEIIYLAGKIEQAGIFRSGPEPTPKDWAYKSAPSTPSTNSLGSLPRPLQVADLTGMPKDAVEVLATEARWPLQIPEARALLSLESVPALQALAQKLVVQTLTTSGFASACAALVQVSTASTTFYEAGAIAALGIVWSMRRMQKKWETARTFWEGEVREEGRRAVRTVEGRVGEVLAERVDEVPEGAEELEQAKKAVEQAQRALDKAGDRVV